MEETEPIKFAVGEEYKNEKGVFEVMSIKGSEMVIRWKSGEEMACDVGLQRRIQERRQWEKMQAEKLAAAALAKSRSASSATAGQAFVGLQTSDFRNKISRTPWRSRKQLGGAVVRQLPPGSLNINSWAAKRRNEIIYADVAQWKAKQNSYPARFFASADDTHLAWGFCVERSLGEESSLSDWEVFLEWLSDGENEKWLLEVASKEGLEVYDGLKSSFQGVLKPGETCWVMEGGADADSADGLKAAIDKWPADERLDLVIAKRLPKADAIDRVKGIAEDIAETIGVLLPLYRKVAVPKR